MIKRLLWVSLGLLVNSAVGATDDIDTIRQKFIGDWELASYYTFPVGGSDREMGYIGRLSYDRFGNMAGLGMPKDLPTLQRESNERLMQGFAYWVRLAGILSEARSFTMCRGHPWCRSGLAVTMCAISSLKVMIFSSFHYAIIMAVQQLLLLGID